MPIAEVIHDLRRVVLRGGGPESEGDLLERFIESRDPSALSALVERHATMVWGVCRRILSSHHDAEDAFQATFLVLVRKVSTIRHKDLLANWLYGVAQQTAMRARAAAFKHSAREKQVAAMPEPVTHDHNAWDSIEPVLDQELGKLPEKYRSLIVLCDLEGKTRKQVAHSLDCPEGTVAGRLARARAMLADRLARRGITASAGLLGGLLLNHAASASTPPALVASTIQAASLYAAGHATAAALSANAVALSEGVIKAMFMTKLKLATAFAAALLTLIVGGGVMHRSLAGAPVDATVGPILENAQDQTREQKREQPKDGTLLKGKIGAIDVENRSVTLVITMFDRKANEANEKEHVLNVPKDAAILQDGVKTSLGDLKRGHLTTVKIKEKDAIAITVDGPGVRGQYKTTNAERNTVTVVAGRDMGEKVYHLLKTTQVLSADGKASKLQDLAPGTEIQLTLSVLGDNTIIRIQTVATETKKRGTP